MFLNVLSLFWENRVYEGVHGLKVRKGVSFRKSVYEELKRFQIQHKEFDFLNWQEGEELIYELERKLMKE